MPGAMTSASDPQRVEVVTRVQRRRRWSLSETLRAVEEASAPGMTISYVARKYGMHPGLLFKWRRLMTEAGQEAVRAEDQVVGQWRKYGSSNARSGNWNACWAKRRSKMRFSAKR